MSKAPKRTRKKKAPTIPKVWEMPDTAVQAIIDHIKSNYPDSAQLVRYENEMQRRVDGVSVEEFYG